ncbi:YesL family protein [Brachybacterium tyrofermentans]|uniref:YesL family protein n=1 Tax=Brachybacterium tyrofermentans TaxID=47848 RepID=UPI000A1A7CCA|nr:hypothetical protein FM103_09800 [Corynebacterium xerosis]
MTTLRPLAGLDALAHRVVQLVWLNLWWSALTLLGGIVLGIGPASVGAHAVASAWARGEPDVDVPRTMWAHWRSPWGRSAGMGLLAIALATSLAVTWWMSRGVPPIPSAVTQGIVLLTALLLAATLPYLPWVLVQLQETLPAQQTWEIQPGTRPRISLVFASALALALSRPLLSIVLVALWIGWPTLLVVSGWPGLLPVLGVGVPFAVSAWCLHRTLPCPALAPSVAPSTDSSPRTGRPAATSPLHDLERKS